MTTTEILQMQFNYLAPWITGLGFLILIIGLIFYYFPKKSRLYSETKENLKEEKNQNG